MKNILLILLMFNFNNLFYSKKTSPKQQLVKKQKYKKKIKYKIKNEYILILLLIIFKIIYNNVSPKKINEPDNSSTKLKKKDDALYNFQPQQSPLIKNILELLNIFTQQQSIIINKISQLNLSTKVINKFIEKNKKFYQDTVKNQTEISSQEESIIKEKLHNVLCNNIFLKFIIKINNEKKNDNNIICKIINHFSQLLDLKKIVDNKNLESVDIFDDKINFENNILLFIFNAKDIYDFYNKIIDGFIKSRNIKIKESNESKSLLSDFLEALTKNLTKNHINHKILDAIKRFIAIRPDGQNKFIEKLLQDLISIIPTMISQFKSFITNNKNIIDQWPDPTKIEIEINDFITILEENKIIDSDSEKKLMAEILQIFLNGTKSFLNTIENIKDFLDPNQLQNFLKFLQNQPE